MMHGIDISNWQRGLDISSLDMDFCIVKATEGLGYTDPSFHNFAEQVEDAGLLFGFYHFARENKPENEAHWFYTQTMRYDGKGIPILDYETSNYDNREWAERFASEYARLSGKYPVIYCSASVCREFAGSWLADRCALWVAGYPYEYTEWIERACPYNVSPWQNCIIWQFTSSLHISDEFKRLDGNIAYIDAETWAMLAGDDMALTDSDIKKIAQAVWEYEYISPDGKHDSILQDLGISQDAYSNRYNVLNAILEFVARIFKGSAR